MRVQGGNHERRVYTRDEEDACIVKAAFVKERGPSKATRPEKSQSRGKVGPEGEGNATTSCLRAPEKLAR